jgi:glutathione S-transferase
MMRYAVGRAGGVRRMLSTGTAKPPLTVYGHYVSQPARSVLWLLKLNDHPFNFVKVEVLKGDARSPDYKSKFPLGLIPAVDDDGFRISECSAILQYLSEKNGWSEWWPSGLDSASVQKRAVISQYLSHHHLSTRRLSREVVFPFMWNLVDKKAKQQTKEEIDKSLADANKILHRFETIFLSNRSQFIGGYNKPTIADLTAYPEIAQLRQLKFVSDFSNHPVLNAWVNRMSALPHHDDIHSSVVKLASIRKPPV